MEQQIQDLLARQAVGFEQALSTQRDQFQQQMQANNQLMQQMALAMTSLSTSAAAAVQAPQGANLGSTEADEIRKLINPRILERAPLFDGADKHFEEWYFSFSATLALLGFERVLAEAVAAVSDDELHLRNVDEDLKPTAKAIWYLLVTVLKGKAQMVLKGSEKFNGLMAWRRVMKECQPNLGGRFNSMLMQILNPKHWADSQRSFLELLDEWTANIQPYTEQSGDVITDRTKIAVVTMFAPKSLENAIVLSTMGSGDSFLAFDTAVRNVVNSTRRFVTTDADAMDVGGIGQAGRCDLCGKTGHNCSSVLGQRRQRKG